MQEIHRSNPPVVTGICDPNKSWAQQHHSLKLGPKLKYPNNNNNNDNNNNINNNDNDNNNNNNNNSNWQLVFYLYSI